MVWAVISLGGHTDLPVFNGGNLTEVRYIDGIFNTYVQPVLLLLAMIFF